MASAVLSEPRAQTTDRGPPLNLSVDAPPSSSPFPSPSSSFLPPPMPGAHEFAMKPPPPGRNARKGSVKKDEESPPREINGQSPPTTLPVVQPQPSTAHETQRATLPASPLDERQQLTPKPLSGISPLFQSFLPTSPSTPTPTNFTGTLPASAPPTPFYTPPTSVPSTPLGLPLMSTVHRHTMSTMSTSSNTNASDSPTPTRPAPPSPAISRRASGAPSTSSALSKSSRSSRPSSTNLCESPSQSTSSPLSRTNSTRKNVTSGSSPRSSGFGSGSGSGLSSILQQSPQTNINLPSPSTMGNSAQSPPSSSSSQIPRSTLIKIRDYAYPTSNEHYFGLGPDVPRPNRVDRLNRRLLSPSTAGADASNVSSASSDEDDDDGDVGTDDDDGWGGFRFGMGRFSFLGVGGNMNVDLTEESGKEFPSKSDMERNFLDGEGEGEGEEEFYSDEEDGGANGRGEEPEEEDPLYPGIYRAMYAFEPEGTAEMALAEDQVVRVIGRGGGVGWAVVIKDWVSGANNANGGSVVDKAAQVHALVPESYLEAVKYDWEDEE